MHVEEHHNKTIVWFVGCSEQRGLERGSGIGFNPKLTLEAMGYIFLKLRYKGCIELLKGTPLRHF